MLITRFSVEFVYAAVIGRSVWKGGVERWVEGAGDSGIGGEVHQRRERQITSAESGISGQIIATLCFSDRQAAARL